MREPDSEQVTLLIMASPARISFPAPSEMAALLAEVVAGVAGGSKPEWRKKIGVVERLPTWNHVTHNWRVQPSGTDEQKDVIERAMQVVRAAHPYVA